MQAFIESGLAVDLILAVIAVELCVLVVWPGQSGRVRAAVDALFTLGPGACLLLALRAALTGAGWMWVALWLASSFPLHVIDLLRRRRG